MEYQKSFLQVQYSSYGRPDSSNHTTIQDYNSTYQYETSIQMDKPAVCLVNYMSIIWVIIMAVDLNFWITPTVFQT